MQKKLHELGITTIGDVARFPETVLCARLGASMGAHLAALARGEDAREVEPDAGKPVSIGQEETVAVDLASRDEVRVLLLRQGDRVAARLRRNGLRARVVQIKIKYADFRLVTRRRSLADATSDGRVIGRVAGELLAGLPVNGRHGRRHRVRLCGVSASGLQTRDAPVQLTLQEPVRRRGERLGDVLDRIEDRFGHGVISRAIHTASPDERDDNLDDPRPTTRDDPTTDNS